MSGRIALMVRGLPSIGIDEAVERFGKYYPEANSNIFHESPSFQGLSSSNSISFVNAKTGDYSGGQGLTQDSRRDLRKLREDFESYTQANPAIYTNSPTSDSRAKLYRRVGFLDTGNRNQVIDTRRIASQDLPYVQAIDASILPSGLRKVLRPNVMQTFISNGSNVLAGSRLEGNALEYAMRGGDEMYMLPDIIDTSFKKRKEMKAEAKQRALNLKDDESLETLNLNHPSWQEFMQGVRSHANPEQNRNAYQNLTFFRRSEGDDVIRWMRRNNFNTFGNELSPSNAQDILDAYNNSFNYLY